MFDSVVLFSVLFSVLAADVRAEEPSIENAVVLEAIDGTALVEVFSGGTWKPIVDGETVEPGEAIRTTAGSARLVYGDGSVVALSTATEVKLEDNLSRVLSLEHGTVWGKIEKSTTPLVSPSPKPYRFLLRSRSVIMGVRGTEFLVETASDGEGGEVTVNTLEGTVDTAPDLPTLLEGKGLRLSQFERIRARKGVALGTTEAFQGEVLVARLKKDHGGLVRFFNRPVRRLRPNHGGRASQIRKRAKGQSRAGRTLRTDQRRAKKAGQRRRSRQ